MIYQYWQTLMLIAVHRTDIHMWQRQHTKTYRHHPKCWLWHFQGQCGLVWHLKLSLNQPENFHYPSQKGCHLWSWLKSSSGEMSYWMDSVKCYQSVAENQAPLKEQKNKKINSSYRSKLFHNIQAEPLSVLSISEKVNGMGALVGCEILTQSSTRPALSDILIAVCSNPTTTSEEEWEQHELLLW